MQCTVLQEVLRGYNGTILAYGQTGSGKTHTLLNVAESASEVGLVQYPYPFVSRLRLHFVSSFVATVAHAHYAYSRSSPPLWATTPPTHSIKVPRLATALFHHVLQDVWHVYKVEMSFLQA